MSMTLAKDFHRLQKNIASFTNNEAKILDFGEDLSDFHFDVGFKISDGFYKDAFFLVQITPENYPCQPPAVRFVTQIFHPNIGDGFEDGFVCLNLLDEWLPSNDLEDVVMGLLFLIKNPNFSDPLNPNFCINEYDATSSEETYYIEGFARDVRKTLEGGEVEGIFFMRNSGLEPQPSSIKVAGFQSHGNSCDEIKEIYVSEAPSSSSNPSMLDKILGRFQNSPTVFTVSAKISETIHEVWNPQEISGVHGFLSRNEDKWKVLCYTWLFRYVRTVPRPFSNLKTRRNNINKLLGNS